MPSLSVTDDNNVVISSDPHAQFLEYLKRRENALRNFYPQWDFTNAEIAKCDDLLKRDGTPICIPPSWDLIRDYAETLDCSNNEYWYDRGKRNYAGDQGEAEFLDLMRNLPIGGILIGNIDSRDMLQGCGIPDQRKEHFMPPDQFTVNLRNQDSWFEMDFLYVHPNLGIYHIEVKGEKHEPETRDGYARFLHSMQGEQIETVWQQYFHRTIRFHRRKDETNSSSTSNGFDKNIYGPDELVRFFTCKPEHNNILKTEPLIRQFVIFLAGYRPDYFISPVQCALKVRRNVFHTHSMWTYHVIKHGHDVENVAMSITEFLESLPFVTHKHIELYASKEIYLTKQQMTAIGCFDNDGTFLPRRQIIAGPPGSGKTLIIMMKIFILGQIRNRSHSRLVCADHHIIHSPYREQLRSFVKNNRSAFCRQVLFSSDEEFKKNNDFTVDDDLLSDEAAFTDKRISDWSGPIQMGVVVTGPLTDWMNINSTELEASDNCDIRKSYQCVTLHTVFRSSKQIQSYFQAFMYTSYPEKQHCLTFMSGHNFDGVKIENYVLSDSAYLEIALERRIEKLLGIENCSASDICIHWNLDWWMLYSSVQHSGIWFCTDTRQLHSVEYPVMILVEPTRHDVFISVSRAMCHVIILTTSENLNKTLGNEISRPVSISDSCAKADGSSQLDVIANDSAVLVTSVLNANCAEDLNCATSATKLTDIIFDGFPGYDASQIHLTKSQERSLACPAKRRIITGVPGSGKTLLFLLELLTAAKDTTRREIPIHVHSSTEHNDRIRRFMKANSATTVRKLVLDSYGTASSLYEIECDVFLDEAVMSVTNRVLSNEHNTDCYVVCVLSSFANWTKILKHAKQVEIFQFDVHFRCTKTIATLWQNWYLSVNFTISSLQYGHKREGIAPEFHVTEHVDDFAKAIRRRMAQLTTVDKCQSDDFVIAFARQNELEVVSPMLEYDGPSNVTDLSPKNKLDTTVDQKKLILEQWISVFSTIRHMMSKGIATVAAQNSFLGLCLLNGEIRNSASPYATKIMAAFEQHVFDLQQMRRRRIAVLSDDAQKRRQSILFSLLYDMELLFWATDHTASKAPLDKSDRNRLAVTFDSSLNFAVQFLNQHEKLLSLLPYFKEMKMSTNSPQMYHATEMHNLEFNVVIVFEWSTLPKIKTTTRRSGSDCDITNDQLTRAVLYSRQRKSLHQRLLQALKKTDAPVDESINAALVADVSQMQLIGRGSTARVFRYEKPDGSAVAVKELYCENSTVSDAIIASRISHANIVQLLAVSTTRLIYELLENGSVSQALEDGNRSHLVHTYTMVWLNQCAQGLSYLHSQSLVHRDIKPSNLLLGLNYSILKIGDLGLMQPVREDESISGKCGTFRYMAPEVMRAEKYDCSSDVYSFAMTAYNIITRKAPFYDISTATGFVLEIAIKQLRPAIAEKMHSSLQKLLEDCWNESPSKRPTMSQAVERLQSLPSSIITQEAY